MTEYYGDMLTIWMREIDKSNPMMSKGGSNFRVTVYGNKTKMRKSVCIVVDHRNTLYSIYCPLFQNSCTHISIILRFTHFEAYNGVRKFRVVPHSKLVWNKIICPSPGLSTSIQTSCKQRYKGIPKLFWILDDKENVMH